MAYVLLVGIPGSGLLGILKLGERLEAPRPIAGRWAAVEGASRAAWDAGCRTTGEADDAGEGPSEVRIDQSGAKADVLWSGPRVEEFRVSLRGDSLEGTLALKRDHRCSGGVLALRAVVREVNARERIIGELRAEDCPACEPIPIDWRRRRPPAPER